MVAASQRRHGATQRRARLRLRATGTLLPPHHPSSRAWPGRHVPSAIRGRAQALGMCAEICRARPRPGFDEGTSRRGPDGELAHRRAEARTCCARARISVAASTWTRHALCIGEHGRHSFADPLAALAVGGRLRPASQARRVTGLPLSSSGPPRAGGEEGRSAGAWALRRLARDGHHPSVPVPQGWPRRKLATVEADDGAICGAGPLWSGNQALGDDAPGQSVIPCRRHPPA